MKNMGNNLKRVFILYVVLWGTAVNIMKGRSVGKCSEKLFIQDDKVVRDYNDKLSTINCTIKILYFGAPWLVSKEIVVNDSVSLFRTQNDTQYFEKTYTQVVLDKNIDKYLRQLICEVYSENKSVIKSDLPDVKLGQFSETIKCSIKVTIDDCEIKECFNTGNYDITYGALLGIKPFHEQFDEIRSLMNAIGYRMEHEFYDFDYNHIDKKRMEENQALGRLYDSESMVEGHL